MQGIMRGPNHVWINSPDLIKKSLAAGISTICLSPFSRVQGANGDIRLAVIGVGDRGHQHLWGFQDLPGVQVVALCDVDRSRLDFRARWFENLYEKKIEKYTDIRRLLDEKDIDAIVIATRDHWHALMTVWACQAGKDVYVEKPPSHNIWEGLKMIQMARRYNRIVQVGLQKRKYSWLQELRGYIQEGNIGRILWARGICYKLRPSIGKTNGPQPISEPVDYDLWCGPADIEPLMRRHLHYDWRWFWNTGVGEIGSQGVHEVDPARYVIGQRGLPARVLSIGGRFGYEDDGQTPNTLVILFDYEPAPLIFEVRGLPTDNYRGNMIGIVIQCEDGHYVGSDGGGWAYDNNGAQVKLFQIGPSDIPNSHYQNFIDIVHSRVVTNLNADIK
jgi:predicted dehydrogenase